MLLYDKVETCFECDIYYSHLVHVYAFLLYIQIFSTNIYSFTKLKNILFYKCNIYCYIYIQIVEKNIIKTECVSMCISQWIVTWENWIHKIY